MKFRQRLFWFLAFVALLWMSAGFMVSGDAYSSTVAGVSSESYQAGAAIGASIGLSLFLCTGLPTFFLFALLAWRNGAGLRAEKRHQEMLTVTAGASAGNKPGR